MVRIAVLGAGRHSSSNHGPSLKILKDTDPGGVELAAVCDLDEDRAGAYAKRFGFEKVYASAEAMISAERLDGIVAVTPIPLTEPIVSGLLPTRIPLLMEKPPGRNSGETKRLLRVAERHAAPHMISFNRRFSPAIAKAREWLSGQGAGRRVERVISRMLRHSRLEPDFVVGTGIHAVDTVVSLLGSPGHVSARTMESGVGGTQTYDARVVFRNGTIGTLIIAPAAGRVEETYEILGADFCIQVDTQKSRLRIFDKGDLSLSWTAADDADPAFLGGALAETGAFIDGIRRGSGFGPDLREGLASMLVSEAIQGGGEADLVHQV